MPPGWLVEETQFGFSFVDVAGFERAGRAYIPAGVRFWPSDYKPAQRSGLRPYKGGTPPSRHPEAAAGRATPSGILPVIVSVRHPQAPIGPKTRAYTRPSEPQALTSALRDLARRQESEELITGLRTIKRAQEADLLRPGLRRVLRAQELERTV